MLLGPSLPTGLRGSNHCFTAFWSFPASAYHTPETANMLIARSGQCLTWHLGRGTMQTDFHMWSLPAALGPQAPTPRENTASREMLTF